MEDTNELDIDSQNDVQEDLIIEDGDDVDALREKLSTVSEQNKQLFVRAKKAEGFELKDGKWVKPERSKETTKETKVDTKPPKDSSQSSELDYGQLALLRTEGIKGSEEVALFKEIMSETGKGVLDVLDSNYFKSRLTDLRETKESMGAIPKGRNRSGQTGVTDTDVAVAKYKEDGTLPSDFKTRSAVVKALEAEETIGGMFDGPAVMGPNRR